MKLYKISNLFILTFALLNFTPVFAQMGGGGMMGGGGNHGGNDDHGGRGNMMGGGMMNGGWCINPDSLTEVTVSGAVLIEAEEMMDMYFLDVDDDGQADYHLNFGPYWYQPDSSNAVKPNAGDVVTVVGGSHESEMFDFDVLVVYEINDEFWRDPFTPQWNNMGGGMHRGGREGHNDRGIHFGMFGDSLETVILSGTVFIDSTLMSHYYLDEDGDGSPDYFLNFGPFWYVPESGAERPANGENISVVGGLTEGERMAGLIVYELNGEVWRDSTSMGGHMGGWISAGISGNRRIHSPFDKDDWMEFRPGWNNNGGGNHRGGMNLPDSIFCQLWEMLPENVPGVTNGQHIAAYQIDIFTTDGGNMMMNQSGHRNHKNFGNQVRFQLHYSEEQLQMMGDDESGLMAQYWDEETEDWVSVSDAAVDAENNIVTFASTKVSSFVVLSSPQTTTSVTGSRLPVDFSLKQNYPNPFNPQTTIAFALENEAHVSLYIYNVIGQHVATLVDENLTSGSHQKIWNAASMTSGIYFYELKIGSQSIMKRMNLLK
jgi:hypothetical protein